MERGTSRFLTLILTRFSPLRICFNAQLMSKWAKNLVNSENFKKNCLCWLCRSSKTKLSKCRLSYLSFWSNHHSLSLFRWPSNRSKQLKNNLTNSSKYYQIQKTLQIKVNIKPFLTQILKTTILFSNNQLKSQLFTQLSTRKYPSLRT